MAVLSSPANTALTTPDSNPLTARQRHLRTRPPAWRDARSAPWLRKNRGGFDREPQDVDQDVEIIAAGRNAWIGWVELATEATNEIGTRTTARVITDIDADVMAIVEAEDRPSMLRLSSELLGERFAHVMLLDGNDER
jgi:hypothetical protein